MFPRCSFRVSKHTFLLWRREHHKASSLLFDLPRIAEAPAPADPLPQRDAGATAAAAAFQLRHTVVCTESSESGAGRVSKHQNVGIALLSSSNDALVERVTEPDLARADESQLHIIAVVCACSAIIARCSGNTSGLEGSG